MSATEQSRDETAEAGTVREEWQATMTRLEELRRKRVALLALRPAAAPSTRVLDELEAAIAKTQSRATALMARVFEDAGLPR